MVGRWMDGFSHFPADLLTLSLFTVLTSNDEPAPSLEGYPWSSTIDCAYKHSELEIPGKPCFPCVGPLTDDGCGSINNPATSPLVQDNSEGHLYISQSFCVRLSFSGLNTFLGCLLPRLPPPAPRCIITPLSVYSHLPNEQCAFI